MAKKKEYDTFVASLEELTQGQETDISIRDLTPGRRKYEWKYVKAIVSSSPDKLKGGDVLWLRFNDTGFRHPQPWAIKVKEILGEYVSQERVAY